MLLVFKNLKALFSFTKREHNIKDANKIKKLFPSFHNNFQVKNIFSKLKKLNN